MQCAAKSAAAFLHKRRTALQRRGAAGEQYTFELAIIMMCSVTDPRCLHTNAQQDGKEVLHKALLPFWTCQWDALDRHYCIFHTAKILIQHSQHHKSMQCAAGKMQALISRTG
jgi:hypothetical protein